MKRTILSLTLGAAIAALPAFADEATDRAKLIALDKAWGEATEAAALEKFLDPRLIAISPEGMADRAQLIASETGPNVVPASYTPGNYKVMFLDDDLAVMVHNTEGDESHYSMHVWEEEDGVWRVVATSSTPLSP